MTKRNAWKLCCGIAGVNVLLAAVSYNVNAVLGWFTVTLFAWRELIKTEEEQ